MGAWGVGVFDNDDALDWLDELQSVNDLQTIADAIKSVIENQHYLEETEGAKLLCACQVLLALKGFPTETLPDAALDWVKKHTDLDISTVASLALQGIDKILDENSELQQLWEENEEDYPIWRESVLLIKQRLNGIR